jgi:molybdate transport system ATP-binding protein
MTVRENIGFANNNFDEVSDILKMVKLENLQNEKPENLSGGQKQRVALARAIARKPKLLLLDEPLSALDLKMRLELQKEILKAHQKFNLTTILISHDISEIQNLTTKVFQINSGKIIKKGNVEDFFGKKLSGNISNISSGELVLKISDNFQFSIGQEVEISLKLQE